MKIQFGLSRRTWSQVAFWSSPGGFTAQQRQLEPELARESVSRIGFASLP